MLLVLDTKTAESFKKQQGKLLENELIKYCETQCENFAPRKSWGFGEVWP